ncbi:MAG: sulfotransferase [Alphaproteobacteria bacterium]|nr:MAG: sulfotransferase [Alphaproteobacteria bacterium]
MRVDFFVAGVQKGGTTALDAMLRQHPEIAMAREKEVHFFDDEDVDWSAPDYGRLHAAYDAGERRLCGEATPIYTYWPNALERLCRYNPNAKIIVGLRPPAFRAYSHWRMEVARGAEMMSFSDAIRAGRDRVSGAPNGVHRVFSYVERGFYDQQLARLIGLFPRAQIHFFRTDHMFRDSAAELTRLFAFLGVSNAAIESAYITPVESRLSAAMLDADRQYLEAIYALGYLAIEAHTGLDLADWRDPHYAEPMMAG